MRVSVTRAASTGMPLPVTVAFALPPQGNVCGYIFSRSTGSITSIVWVVGMFDGKAYKNRGDVPRTKSAGSA